MRERERARAVAVLRERQPALARQRAVTGGLVAEVAFVPREFGVVIGRTRAT